jgi:hypothetical protein
MRVEKDFIRMLVVVMFGGYFKCCGLPLAFKNHRCRMAMPSNRQKLYCYLWTTLVYGRVNTGLRSGVLAGGLANPLLMTSRPRNGAGAACAEAGTT